MQNSFGRTVFAVSMATFIAACVAKRGTYVEWEDANKVRNGMTQEQVIALMGEEPNTVVGNGEELIWSYAQVNALTGGTYSRAIKFKFDKNGRTYDVPEGGVAKYQQDHDL